MESLKLFIFSILILLNLFFQVLFAADSINSLQPLSDGEILVSSNQTFELGFFSPKNSTNRYLGIWFLKIPGTVVWVANRNSPITDRSGVLNISGDGNIVILDQSKSVIWSTNVSTTVDNPIARLLDSGNLVLMNNNSVNSGSYLWQSFDYPSDTLLAGMKLGWNLKIGLQRYLTSWRTDNDPSLGNFTYKLDIDPLPQLFTRRGSVKFARIGPWNGAFFIGLPKIPYTVIRSTTIDYEDEIAYTYETVSSSVITVLTLNQSGILERLVWNDTINGWGSINLGPSDQCDSYGKCGANGKCNGSNEVVCECLKGYVAKSEKEWEAQNWTRGCVRSKAFECQKPPVFFKLESVKLPDLLEFQVNNSISPAECNASCSNNCDCRAYSYSNPSEGGSGCFMWFGDMVDTNVLSDAFRTQDLYIRVSASDLEAPKKSSKKKRVRYVILISVSTIVVISLMILFFYIVKKRRQKTGANVNTEETEGIDSNSQDMEVPLFDVHTISAATNNFSVANVIGEGGFGPVYKGILFTGQEIAVKRLSSYSRQGVDEFRNEVLLIVKLQHRNLVGLLGCCTQGEEKMLIYEYLPNKSLDHFIFDDGRSCLLSWKKRYDIILGIARGLLYLHQDSKLQIVHRDLKASNVLLDSNLNPKISDFGLARILGDDEHEAKTKRVAGTYGYMSPEYAVDGKFSTKSDVFSLGVLILEIVSGKRNRGFVAPDHHHNLVGHAWLRWNQGTALEIMDTVYAETCIESQVLRCIHVGLLCVQKLPVDRPTMSSVVFMLGNEGAMLPEPKEPGFFTERSSIMSTSSSEAYTGNSLTITTMDAR